MTKIRHGLHAFGARHLPLRLGGFHDPTCSAMANGGFRPPQDAANGYKWELSNINDDDSHDIDLAAKMPNKLRQMQEIFTMEATRDNVLPLDNTVLPRLKRPRLVLAEDQSLPGIGMFVEGSRRDVQRTAWGALDVLPSSEGPS